MKGKTILFGTILAVFLMLITPTISTVNANICEKQINENIIEKLNDSKSKITKLKDFNLDMLCTRLLGLLLTSASVFIAGMYLIGIVFFMAIIGTVLGLISGVINGGEFLKRGFAGLKAFVMFPIAYFILGMNLLFEEGETFTEVFEKAINQPIVKEFFNLLYYLIGLTDSPDLELV